MSNVTTMDELVEVAALRVAQMRQNGPVDGKAMADVVVRLRRAFPEWRDVYGPSAVHALAVRFDVSEPNPTACYFDTAAK